MSAKRTYSINKLPADKTDWNRLARISDAKINARAKNDHDAIPLNLSQLKKFKRVHPPQEVSVRDIRQQLHLSQDAFAAYFGISKRTVQEWEQGRRHPVGAAKILLTIISHEPEAVQRALLYAHH